MTDLKMMFRHFRVNRFMTITNLLGLTVGMTVFLLIAQYIRQEASYDSVHPENERIYVIDTRFRIGSDQELFAPVVSAPMVADISREIPEIEAFVRLDDMGNDRPFRYEQNSFIENDVYAVDSSFFDILGGYQLLQGDPKTVLTLPNSIAISEETARKYFGTENPMGKELTYQENTSFTITGIYRNPKGPTLIGPIPILISWSTYATDGGYKDDAIWLSSVNYIGFVRLAKGAEKTQVETRIAEVMEKYTGELLRQLGGEASLTLAPIRDMHLYASYTMDVVPNGVIKTLYELGAIGMFILLIACLNYVNLTTAIGMRRAASVGISKTLGATRPQLIRQFLFESGTLALVAMLLSILITVLIQPSFNSLFGTELLINPLHNPFWVPTALLLAIIIGILAGIYPAVMLSSYQPVKVLKGEVTHGKSGNRIRSTLVVLQFSMSVLLIISTLVVMRQMDFIRKKDIGFDRKHVIAVRLSNWDLMTRSWTLKEELDRNSAVLMSATADHIPFGSNSTSLYHIPGTPLENQLIISVIRIDHDYIPLMGMRLVSGRNFEKGRSSDSTNAVIINQAAARILGYEDAVGMQIDQYEEVEPIEFSQLDIIGVIEDFNQESLRSEIHPLFFRIYEGQPVYLFFRLQPNGAQEFISDLEARWTEFAPSVPLNYFFLDESFDQFYESEMRLQTMFNWFTLLAIFVASLGLFALATFAAERRTKEIGIRKVLGATIPEMVSMLIKEFILLVGIANIIAWPVAWWVMNGWLQSYVYRAELSPFLFIGAGLLSLFVAILTVSSQALRAAVANPVDSLRYE